MANAYAQSPSLTNFLNELDTIKSQSNYSLPMKLPIPKPTVVPVQPSAGAALGQGMSRSPGGVVTVQPSSASTTGAADTLSKLIGAIKQQESSNNYGATNKDSGAAGGYQIMPSNFTQTGSGWDYEALGHDVSLQQFMTSPQIQDAIARYKLNQYLQKYGSPAAAAVAWYGGPGAVSNMYSTKTQTGGYPSLYAYWQSVLSKM